MDDSRGSEPYYGVFRWDTDPEGGGRLLPDAARPASIPDPCTGRQLRISTVQGGARAICPSCAKLGDGGFVSFVADLRLAYACPACRQLVWIRGA